MSTPLRPIRRLSLPDVLPGGDTAEPPQFEWVDPTTLVVDETYQRNLSERSLGLIRRIVACWDWRGFKPPVVVITDEGRWEVVDGQHTAISAASHPGVGKIPVMVVAAASKQDRATAFVRHNRDRISVTGLQLHKALVAAGDEDALTVAQVCARAGVNLLAMPPYQGRYSVGDTLAVASIRALVERRHAMGARQVLEVCSGAMLAPISASAVKAVETIMFGEEHKGQVTPEALTLALRELGADAERQAKRFAFEHRIPQWRALVAILFRNTPKVRRGQRAAA